MSLNTWMICGLALYVCFVVYVGFLGAKKIKGLSDFAVAELICAGSVMIVALGLNLLKVTKIKVANLLPGLVFVPFVCMIFELVQ